MANKPNPFANRIVGYTVKRASELTGNPSNWRTHPQKQRAAVQASLRELGWIAAVVENTRSGFLIDGHERVWQALQNDEEVPVLQVDLSEEEERLALATFDPITYMAETDAAQLEALLQGVNTGEAALQELLAGLAQDAGMYGLPPSLDELAEKYGEPAERDFWPVIRIQVSPQTKARFDALLGGIAGDDEADRFAQLLDMIGAQGGSDEPVSGA